jgi:DNA-binding transcriptional LysR family regulator
MTIIQLRYFLATCEFGKIRTASEQIHVSEPTISTSIKRLEEELGVLLFARDKGQLLLTDAGKRLREKAAEVVETFDRLEEEMQPSREQFPVIRLGAPTTLSRHLCSPLIAKFSAQYPNVLFETHSLSPEEAAQQVEKGRLELAICDQPAVTSSELIFFSIVHSTLSGYVRNDHPLAGTKNVIPQMLKEEKLILLRDKGAVTHLVKQWFYRGGVNPNLFTYSDREILSFTFSMVKQRSAIAFLLDNLYTESDEVSVFPPDGIATFSLEPPLSMDFGIIRKKSAKLSQSAQLFLDFCIHYQHQ